MKKKQLWLHFTETDGNTKQHKEENHCSHLRATRVTERLWLQDESMFLKSVLQSKVI